MGKLLKFLQIKNQQGERAEIYITGDIVDDCWNYGWANDPNVYPMNIKKMLDEVKGKDIDVYINSGGGHIFAGVAISHMLSRHDGKTRAIIDGIAASAASVIAFGCDEIEMPRNSYLMIHKPMCSCFGNSDELLKTAEWLDVLQKGILETYMAKANEGITEDQINELVNAETYFTGDQAAEFFNVVVTKEQEAVAYVGDYAEKLVLAKHLPILRQDNQKENMEREIDLALALALV